MSGTYRLTRRSVLRGASGLSAAGLASRPGLVRAQDATPGASPMASPQATPMPGMPLWEAAWQNGVVYGTSLATWQAEDTEYLPVVEREAAILFTEDDLLWWRLKPTPDSGLDFTFGDMFMDIAEQHGSLVLGAHLVWDEGFGEGWTEDDL
jgi:endo-1,4-beta-xylanase